MSTPMKFRLRSLFVGVGLAMLAVAGSAEAQRAPLYDASYAVALPLFMDTRANPSSLPGAGWYTTAVIQNMSSTMASVRVTAKAKQGATGGGSVTFTLDPGKSKVLRPDNAAGTNLVGIPAIATGNFEGSLFVESDQPIVVVGQLANILLGSMGTAGGKAKGFFNGMASSKYDLAFPGMKSGFNGKSTVLYVQNVGTTSASTTLTVKTNDGLEYRTTQITLGAGESKAFQGVDFRNITTNETWTKTCSGPANTGGTGAACFGTVKIADSDSFAAIAVQRDVVNTNPTLMVQVSNAQRVVNPVASVSCPVFRNAYVTSTRSGVGIMNAGSSNADITLKLLASSGATYTQTFLGVPPDRSVVASYWAGTIGGFPNGAIGAATITSTSDSAPIAFMSEGGSGTSESSSQCSTELTNTVFAPFVKFDYSDTDNHPVPATSEVRIQNTGTTAQTISATYYCRAANSSTLETYTFTTTDAVSPGMSIDINSASFITTALPSGIPTGRICSAYFTTASSIVGTVTDMSHSSTPWPADDATYELDPLQVALSGAIVPMSCPSSVGLKSLCAKGDCCTASPPTFCP